MSIISQGSRVRVERLNHTEGIVIEPSILNNRRIGVEGIALNVVPGHGGDVWFVQQENGIAVYSVDELVPIINHSRQWTTDEIIEREA